MAIAVPACTGAAVRAVPSAPSIETRPAPVASPVIAQKPTFANAALAAWLTERLPKGGSLVEAKDHSIGVVHTVEGKETVADIAEAYVHLSTVYLATDLAEAIRAQNRLAPNDAPSPGARLEIPSVLVATPKKPSEARLGWPDDKILRGLHLRPQVAAGRNFPRVLDAMAARGMNLVVIDVKDADGKVSYPSKVPLANEIGAVKNPSIKHLWRTVQLAHDHGIRVAMRIVCFQDLLLSRVRDDLAVQSIRKRPLRIG